MTAFVLNTMWVVAALVLGPGVAKADGPSMKCTDLHLTTNFVHPISTIENPGGHAIPPLDSLEGELPSRYLMDLYGPGAEDILHLGGPHRGVIAGSGDDRIFAFNVEAPGLVVAEGGADTVIFCSLGAPYSAVTMNSSIVNPDSEPDTLILGPDVFRNASDFGSTIINWGGREEELDGARILITGFDPGSDRIVLRPSWPIEVRRVAHNPFNQTIYAGPVELVFSFFERGLDPLQAVSVSLAPDEETVADIDVGALLELRSENPHIGVVEGDVHSHEESTPQSISGDLGDGHKIDDGHGGGDGHGMGLDSLSGAREAAARCSDVFDPSALNAAAQDQAPDAFDEREATWRDGGDTLAYFGDGVPQYLMSGGGDDLIWLFDIEEGTEIVAGEGSDLIILCSLKDVSATVWLERGDAGSDDEPDTLVISAQALEGIPQGFQRAVSLHEYDPRVDRLVLPAGPWRPVAEMNGTALSSNDTNERTAIFNADVSYGPIRVTLHLGQSTDPATLYRSVSVGGTNPEAHIRDLTARRLTINSPASKLRPVDTSTWDLARTLAGSTVTISPPYFDCIAPPTESERPQEQELDEHDALLVEYGKTNDTIIVRSIDESPEAGFLSQSRVHSGAGEDVVYSFTSNAALVDGPGVDLSVICDVDGLRTELVAPPDGTPDIVIVDAAVFRKPIAEGFERVLSFEGYGEPEDTLILRLPADAQITPYLGAHYRVEMPQGATRLSLNRYRTANPDARLRPETIIIWPEQAP